MMKSNNLKALFVTHPISLGFDSNHTGGVQLCSQEFFHVIQQAGFDVEIYNITYTNNFIKRSKLKFGFSNYDLVDEYGIGEALISKIQKEQIDYVFLNMAGLIRLSHPIKEAFGDKVQVFLLSHGNDSGDFLNLLLNPINKQGLFKRYINTFRLGLFMKTESYYRHNYLDGVITVSETEKQIENWLGAKKSIFIGHSIEPKENNVIPVKGRIGFIGRLDHPPNYHGFNILLKELEKLNLLDVNIRLIGAPKDWGEKLQRNFKNVEYLGELSNEAVIDEINTWQLQLNPVFWYATGYSTKLGWALSYGFPIISTEAGNRGYIIDKNSLLLANSPAHMAQIVQQYLSDDSLYNSYISTLRNLKIKLPNVQEVANLLNQQLNQ